MVSYSATKINGWALNDSGSHLYNNLPSTTAKMHKALFIIVLTIAVLYSDFKNKH